MDLFKLVIFFIAFYHTTESRVIDKRQVGVSTSCVNGVCTSNRFSGGDTHQASASFVSTPVNSGDSVSCANGQCISSRLGNTGNGQSSVSSTSAQSWQPTQDKTSINSRVGSDTSDQTPSNVEPVQIGTSISCVNGQCVSNRFDGGEVNHFPVLFMPIPLPLPQPIPTINTASRFDGSGVTQTSLSPIPVPVLQPVQGGSSVSCVNGQCITNRFDDGQTTFIPVEVPQTILPGSSISCVNGQCVSNRDDGAVVHQTTFTMNPMPFPQATPTYSTRSDIGTQASPNYLPGMPFPFQPSGQFVVGQQSFGTLPLMFPMPMYG
jgi:aspartate carbamoyltransferase regulatory subunit